MPSSSEIRDMDEGTINSRIAELEEERFRLVFRSGTETLEDPLRLRVIRRDVARLKTILREKTIGIREAGTSASLPPRDAKAGNRSGASAKSAAGQKGKGTRRTRRTASVRTRAEKKGRSQE